jgi:hypothetical protein
VKPKHLLLAPLVVWSAAGLILLLDGRRALDYFPFLWAANDISFMIAFAGVMLHLFRGGDPVAPQRDEWTDFRPLPEFDMPLEELLVALARRIEAETGPK